MSGAGLPELLREIESRGLSITAAGSDLRLQGPRERIDAALVARLRGAKAEILAHLAETAEASARRGFPLTLLQRGYLIGRGDAVETGNVASHVYHEIAGCWDVERLEAALRAVVDRHGMLRTRFTDDGRQVEEPAPTDVRIGRLDLRGESAELQEQRLAELREARSHRILPADRAPLLAVDVTVLAEDRMILHVGHDGLVMDGISMFLFFRDWWEAYSGTAAGAAEEASFEAYVAAVEAARTKAPAARSREYWLARLDDLAPHPDLPLASTPAAITHPRYTQHVARLAAPAWVPLKARAAAAGLTPTGVLLAAYAEALHRWGAGARFTLNTTFANRLPIHPRILEAIGCFSETMLVEVAPDRAATFAERAAALQAQLRRDLDHRHFSGIEVLRELGRRQGGPVRMPYTFNSAVGYARADVDASALELFGPEVHTSSQTPQVWLNCFAFEQHGGVVVQFDALDGLFPEGMIADMVGGFQRLLVALGGEEAWSARSFDLLPEAQKARRAAANATAAPRAGGLLQEAFLRRAAAAPDAPAIVTAGGTTTYGELYRHACAAAGWLRAKGVGPDELVGLVLRRGPEQVAGILATVIAGGAYLPIDAGLPLERQRYMVRDGRVRCVLTNVAIGEPLGEDLAVLPLDCSAPPPADPAPVPPHPAASDADLAYVLYTSGTTGEPKGVMVSHRSVANVVADCQERFAVRPDDRFFGISAVNFDLSVWDVFGALSAGAAIVLPEHGRATDPAHWLELAGAAGVTVWNSVPAIVGLLHEQAVAEGRGLPPSLRLVMMSGDRIPPDLPAALWALKDDLQVVSLGGPTETTIWNILHPVGRGPQGESIPYGRPNANNRAYVLDAEGQDAPDWVTGEICAAGTGLARGYWGDEARTAERFFDDPARGERIFRTGDLGRYLPDGTIGILGRSDFQIKVNGYRIEAGEVETRLVAVPGVRQAVVARQPGARGDRLVAHLVAEEPGRPDEERIRKELRQHLPGYMIPSLYVWHERLPLTRNGKVDRTRLAATAAAPEPARPPAAAGGPAGEPPAGELERSLAGIWAAVLRVDEAAIDRHATLPDLGGDSLAAVRILTAVRKRFGVGITLDRMPEVETVRAMAAHIEAAGR